MSKITEGNASRAEIGLEPLKIGGQLKRLAKIEKTITVEDRVFHGEYNRICREIVVILRGKK